MGDGASYGGGMGHIWLRLRLLLLCLRLSVERDAKKT